MMDQTTTAHCTVLDAEQLVAIMALFKKLRRVLEPCIQGHSMAATIPDGTRIRIQCGPEQPYVRGDIVACLVGNRLVVHRVVYCGRRSQAQGYLITQGDAMLVPDAPVCAEAVLGPITAIWREGDWQPPGAPGTRLFRQRCIVTVSRLLLCTTLELYVPMAQRLARALRVAVAVVSRVRARPAIFRKG